MEPFAAPEFMLPWLAVWLDWSAGAPLCEVELALPLWAVALAPLGDACDCALGAAEPDDCEELSLLWATTHAADNNSINITRMLFFIVLPPRNRRSGYWG
jgi:hypothetical protein